MKERDFSSTGAQKKIPSREKAASMSFDLGVAMGALNAGRMQLEQDKAAFAQQTEQTMMQLLALASKPQAPAMPMGAPPMGAPMGVPPMGADLGMGGAPMPQFGAGVGMPPQQGMM